MQFDGFLSNCDHFSTELDTYGDLMFLTKSVIDELEKEARFADAYKDKRWLTCIADDDEFEHIRKGHT